MSGAVPPLAQTPLWNTRKQLYLSAQPYLFQKSSFYEWDLFLEMGQVVM